ncbi:M13-type metalloendopeptidase [Metamycoplasma buccale]|uniref:M13-type metalloendopeptidase n=1 Tax=Metamycoplasma buccale TaxID=55602 RepID=UPI00398F3CD5
MEKELIKKDFYEAVNGDWLKKHKIPEHRVGWGSFYQIDENLRKLKTNLLNKWVNDNSEIQDEPMLIEMIKLYKLVKDWKSRREHGLKPIMEKLHWVENLSSWKDVEDNYQYMAYNGYFLPLIFFVEKDFKDSSKQILGLSDTPIILPEKNYYKDKNKSEQLLSVYSNMVKTLLFKIIKNKDKVDKLVNDRLALDKMFVEYALSAEESAEYTKLYNIIDIDKINQSIKVLDVNKITEKLVGQKVMDLNIINTKLLDGLNNLFNNETFELYKSSLYIETLLSACSLLDNKTREIAGTYSRALSGIKKPKSKDKEAIDFTISVFDMPFGLFYGKKYFGEEGKKNVEYMVHNMIKIYQDRLERNTWLGEKTREKAILKLSKIGVHIGYPSEIRPFYKNFIVKKYNGFDDLLKNVNHFFALQREYEFKQYLKPVNKNLWSMSPALVNAYFNPNMNHIVFPAAIFNVPFYSPKQTSSENYGGIGAVIAHEISHAFDNNGANFDENGNMANWWTKEDKENFDLKAQKMIKLFDQVETSVGKCNGKLTVSENIADAGGVSCALEAAKLEKDFNVKKFYINFAKVWRNKYRDEFAKMLLNVDVHAPAKLRANIQIKNSDDFYKAFKIKENDPMFLNKKDRVKIW